MIEPYRRHVSGCPHRAKGAGWTKCSCPIWAYGDLGGRKFRRSLKTRDWSRALKRIEALEDGRITTEPPRRLHLSVVVADYEADCRTRGLAESTLKRRRPVYRDLVAALGTRPIDSIATADLAAFRDGRSRAPATVRLETEMLRALFAFAKGRGLTGDNQAAVLKNPRDPNPGALPFTEPEVQRLIAAADQPRNSRSDQNAISVPMCRALVLVLLNTGLRISDVAQLRRDAIKGGYLFTRTQKTQEAIKLRLEPSTLKALRDLPGDEPHFFWSGKGSLKGRCTALAETLAAIGRAAKVAPCHAHRFRDTFASRLLLAGVEIRTVARLLGHRSIRTTERHYAHWVQSHQALLDHALQTLHAKFHSSEPGVDAA